MKFIRLYYWLRIIIMGASLLLLNIFMETEENKTYLNVSVYILIADCGITNIILIVSLKIFTQRFGKTHRFEEGGFKKLRREYIVMIIVSLLRIINALFFVTLPQFEVIPEGDCLDSFSNNPLRTIFFNGVENCVNHLLPIIWVLKIYNLS